MANANELEALYNNYQQDSSMQESLGQLYDSYNPVQEAPSRPISARVGDIGYELAGHVEMLGRKYRDLRKKAEATQATSAPMPEPWNVLGEEKKLLLDIAKPVPALAAAGGAEALAGGARFFGSDDFANEMTESAKAVREQIQKELPVEEGSLDEALRGALTSIYTIAPGLISGTGFALLGREAAIPMLKAGTLASMGAQSAGQTLNEQMLGGSDRLTAATAATVNAAAEVIPEMLSWNILFGKGTAIGKRAAQLYLSEILGENATTATNLATQKFTIKPDMTSEEAIEALKDTTRQTILMTSILQAPNAAIGMHNRGLTEDNAKLKEIVETDQEATATQAAEVTSLTEEEEADARRLASLALRETAIPTPKPEDIVDAIEVLKIEPKDAIAEEASIESDPNVEVVSPLVESPVASLDVELPENKLNEEANSQLDKVLEPIDETIVEEPTPLIETPTEPAPAPKSYVPIVNMQNPLDNSVDYTERGAARLVVDGPAGTTPSPENVKTIIIDPDGFEPGEMISGIRGIVEGLKAQFPKAQFSVVDSMGDDAPVELFKAKSIGNSNLAKIKKIFGATEDINPRVNRANVSPEEKVARLLLKDKKATAELAKTHPEMVNKLLKDAGRGGELSSEVVGTKLKPTIEPGVWYRGIKDGAVITSQDLSKIEGELGAGALIEKGTLEGTSFTPKEVVQKEESVLTKIIRNMPPVGLSVINIAERGLPKSIIGPIKGIINDSEQGKFKINEMARTITDQELAEIPAATWKAIDSSTNVNQRVQIEIDRLNRVNNKSEFRSSWSTAQKQEIENRHTNVIKKIAIVEYVKDLLTNLPIGLSTQTPEQILATQEAKAKLADTMLTLIRQAAGRPVDDFATQQGFTPEQITAMKDAVRGFIAESDELKIEKQNKKKGVKQLTTTQKAQIIRKELKMNEEDWIAFKLASVGKESMGKTSDNPMTPEEKKKVLNDLLALYEEKQGEKYSFKNKSDEDLEVSIALKQIVGLSDRELSRKELLEKVLRTAIMTGRYDLRKTKAGSVLAKILDRIVSESTIETGGLLDPLRKVSSYLQDNNERLSKLLIAAEKAEIGWDKFLATLKGKDLEAMSAYKQLMNTLQQMAINRGIEVTTVEMEGGKVKLTKEPFPTDMNKIYFPHMLVDQRDELSAKNHERAIRSLMQPSAKNPEGRTAREAAQLLDAIRKSKKGMVKDPYLEYARQYDVEGFNTNILEVATLYTARAVKRMYTIDYFGFDQKKIDTLITQHAEQGGDRSVAEYVASQVLGTGQIDSKLWMRQLANAAVGFEVISKMGPFSALAQLGQLGFIYEETDLKTMARTTAKFLKGATREEAISFGYRSGAALGSIIKEFQDYIRNDTLVDKYLAASGFTPLDRFARITAAAAGREYVTDLFEKVKRNPNKSGSAKARLRQFGIDAERVLAEGRKLSDEELRFAGLQMSEKTQYRGGALNLPPWVTPTPVIRMLTLFHQFSYHRVRTMVDRFNENPTHFAKRLIPSLLSSTAFGALGSEIRRLFTGKESPDEWWKLWFEYLVMGGWFGMANDAIQAVFRSPQGLLSYVGGPVASDIARAFYDGARAVAGNVKGLLKDATDVATYGATRVNPALGVGVGLAGKTIKGRVLTERRD